MNLASIKQKVAMGSISGMGGMDMFHFLTIPHTWCKIDVKQVLSSNVPFMFKNEDAEQTILKDVKGRNTIWD